MFLITDLNLELEHFEHFDMVRPTLQNWLPFRVCLLESGEPQVGEVTRLGGVKNNPRFHATL